MYYFAYGSNIDSDQMKDRCSNNFKQIGIATLYNYRLTFTKKSQQWKSPVADIIKVDGDYVLGILYSINETCLNSLDVYEDQGNMYDRVKIQVEINNDIYTAFTYQSDNPGFDQPANDYLNTIINAMKTNKFPDEYINKLEELKN